MVLRWLALLLAATLTACGSNQPPSPDLDGGTDIEDAGTAPEDAGPAADGGTAPVDGGVDGGTDNRSWPPPDFARRVPSELQDPALGVNLYFSPVDDTRAVVLRELGSTTRKLHVAMFNMRDTQVGNRLLAMHDAGVAIQILWDQKQADEIFNDMDDLLRGAGVDVRYIEMTGAAEATLHDKFAIFDDARMLTGSANWSVTGFTQNHEHLLTVAGRGWPAKYEAKYQEILDGGGSPSAYDPDAGMNVLFGPEDRLDQRVKARIRAAVRSIYVAMFDLSLTELVTELIQARQRGVRVIFVMDKGQADEDGGVLDERLEDGGVVVVRGKPPLAAARMHQKYSVYDEEWVIAGSYNWTALATFYNRENLVELRSPRLAARTTANLLELLQRFDTAFTDVERPPARYGFTDGGGHSGQVTFEVREPTLRTGDTLYVGGEPQALGGWDQARALPMTRRPDGYWERTVMLPAGRTAEYKYLIKNRFGALHWEGGPKHFYTPVFAPAQQRWADVFLFPPEG